MLYSGFSILLRSIVRSAGFVRRWDNLDVIPLEWLNMTRTYIIVLLLAIFTGCRETETTEPVTPDVLKSGGTVGSTEPTPSNLQDEDSTVYKQAYELLFDYRARAMKARDLLLPQGRSLKDLSDKELSLLARAYNELSESKEQLAVARELWTRTPGGAEATRWMTNSLLNVYSYAEDPQPLFDFVDSALSDGVGNRRDLLILKANATLSRADEQSDAQKRATVADLLVAAYSSGPGLPMTDDDSFTVIDSPNFVDTDHSFSAFFSIAERDALKVRMLQARELAEEEKTRNK